MRRVMTMAMLVLACLLAAGPVAAQPVPLTTLFAERARFAERVVIVGGTVTFASPPAGGAQRFTISDAGASMDVLALSGVPVRVGTRVEVEGTYKLGPNAIEAFRVTLR